MLKSEFTENVYYLIGIINMAIRNIQEAVKNYTQVVNISPNSKEAYLERIPTHAMLQNHEQVKKI